MLVQHNSLNKIEKVSRYHGDDLLGCLCFAELGHTYNLAGKYNYSYVLDIDNVLDMSSIWYEHDSDSLSSEAEEIINDMIDTLNTDRDTVLNLLDASETDFQQFEYAGMSAGWYIQQCKGLIAHALGYDAAEDYDEQGAVYVAYCVDREMQEVVIQSESQQNN